MQTARARSKRDSGDSLQGEHGDTGVSIMMPCDHTPPPHVPHCPCDHTPPPRPTTFSRPCARARTLACGQWNGYAIAIIICQVCPQAAYAQMPSAPGGMGLADDLPPPPPPPPHEEQAEMAAQGVSLSLSLCSLSKDREQLSCADHAGI